MDDRYNFYGNDSQQPYVPQHEKPATETSCGSTQTPPPQQGYGSQGYGQQQPRSSYEQQQNGYSDRPYNGGYNQQNSYSRQNNYGQQNSYGSQNSYNQPNGYDQPRRPVYDRFMYEPIGFEELERAKAPLADQELSSGKKRRKSETAAVKLFAALLIVAGGLSIFGIVHDIVTSKSIVEKIGPQQQVVLYKESKPKGYDDAEKYKDENGKYTPEGAAALVRPSIVKIYTYSDYSAYSAKRPMGTGSGIVLNEDGYIATNAHVLEAEGYHRIETMDGDFYDAKIVGRDAKTDIAVIKVNAKGLKPAILGDSDEAVVGEQVIAIGNPANLSSTVTDGIVSAVNRKIKSDSSGFEMDCLQTNAEISPGNSGGALVNMYGQVIGITSSKYVSNDLEGLGFAITINEAYPVIEQLVKNGFVAGRFRIGIQLRDMASDAKIAVIEEKLGFELPDDFKGVYIEKIDQDADIAKSELKEGDFITEINGKTVSTYDELYDTISSQFQAGDTVPATCAHLEKGGKLRYYQIKFKLMEDTSGNY